MEYTALRLVEGPDVEPLDVAYIHQHLRLDLDDEDDLVDVWIPAARQKAEQLRDEILITQTWELVLDRFPSSGCPIVLPKKPVQSVLSIEYVDPSGEDQTFGLSSPPTEYEVIADAERPLLALRYGQSWPETARVAGAVTIQFIAGYGDAPEDVPEFIRALMALLVGHFYKNREAVADGSMTEVPLGIRALLEVPKVG